jgi:hypothetical protein
MYRTHLLLAVVAFACLCGAETHPRLLIGAAEVQALKARLNQAPMPQILTAMKASLAQGNFNLDRDDRAELYNTGPRNRAVLWLLTGDKTHLEAGTADARSIAQHPWLGDKATKGLSRAAGGLTLALFYDLAYAGLSPADRELFSKALRRNADSMIASMGKSANNSPANNWQGVRWGCAGLQLLASDEPGGADLAKQCYAKVKQHLAANLGDNGWNPEGIGYTGYPWSFVGPFGIAAQRAGLGDLRQDMGRAVQMTWWHIWAGTVGIPAKGVEVGLRADLADDNPYRTATGSAPLAFWYADPKLLPAVRFMFDALYGDFGDKSWDAGEGGGLYTALLYPMATPAQNPKDLAGLHYADRSQGVQIFRNAFTATDQDVVALVNAASRRPAGAHGGPDTNTFRILGLGGQFVVGGGRTGDPNGQSNLFPGKPGSKASGDLGKLEQVETTPDGGGCAVLSGSCMGVTGHRRVFAVDYSGRAGVPAVFVNAETSANGRLWRLQTPEFNQVTSAGSTFTITSPNGATLVATVLQPAKPVFRTGSHERPSLSKQALGYHGKVYTNNSWIEFDCEGQVLVVMTLQAGKAAPPAVTGTGDAAAGELSIGRLRATVAKDRISFAP